MFNVQNWIIVWKQECIPVGCVSTVAVAITKCQYRGRVGRSPFWKHYLPLRSVIKTKTHYVTHLHLSGIDLPVGIRIFCASGLRGSSRLRSISGGFSEGRGGGGGMLSRRFSLHLQTKPRKRLLMSVNFYCWFTTETFYVSDLRVHAIPRQVYIGHLRTVCDFPLRF